MIRAYTKPKADGLNNIPINKAGGKKHKFRGSKALNKRNEKLKPKKKRTDGKRL